MRRKKNEQKKPITQFDANSKFSGSVSLIHLFMRNNILVGDRDEQRWCFRFIKLNENDSSTQTIK